MSPNILVMGASGPVGVELVNRLAHIGTEVRAAVFDPLKLQTLFHYPNVETVSFNFEDENSINSALQGISKLFLICPLQQHLSVFTDTVMRVAGRVGLNHIGFLSVLGADDLLAPTIAQWFNKAEFAVKNSTVPYTILRSNCIMQNILQFLNPESSTINLPAGDGAVSFVDARDVAAVVADLFLPGAHHYGKIYNLTGAKSYSMAQVAEILSRVIGQRIGYGKSTKDAVFNFHKNKIDEWRLEPILQFVQYLFSGKGAEVYSTIEDIAGIEPVAFVDFARDYAQTVRSIVIH